MNPHGISTTSPSNSRVCLFHHPRLSVLMITNLNLLLRQGAFLAGVGATGCGGPGLLKGADLVGIAARPSKMLPLTRRVDAYARKIEVEKNTTAHAQVILVRKLPAPLAPKTVELEPPKTAPTSAPLPCCKSTMMTIVMQTTM